MSLEPSWSFPPFCLDVVNMCLWRGTRTITLMPKDFAVLHYLVAHPGRLVTKEALLYAVWPDTHVSAGVLKVCIRRIRRVLGDKATAPQFIETLHRRGYWFIAPVTTGSQQVQSLNQPHFLALLAQACEKVGQVKEGLSVLDEALGLVHKDGERFYEAELYRLKGELTLAQSRVQSLGPSVEKGSRFNVQSSKLQNSNPLPPAPSPQAEVEAEACFLKAIDIAHHQSTKSWELRAVMSLSWLWQAQGKKKQARRMLAEIYSWFTEGFDTADLREAKELLEALGEK